MEERKEDKIALEEEIKLMKELRRLVNKVGHAAKSNSQGKRDQIPKLLYTL